MTSPSNPSLVLAEDEARHLLFLADLFSRAAAVVMATGYIGHPLTIAAALMECLKGKLLRGEITRQDVRTVPVLLSWVSQEIRAG